MNPQFRSRRIAGLAVALIAAAPGVWALAQDSAPSSHLVFDDAFDGDILINEVRVPKSGATKYTYYETLGWRGAGAGYAGIQSHPTANLYIFSIWDHPRHAAPIRAVYRGPGTETVGFGGEGTGLKSWNFKLGWSTDVWYTFVARTWPVADHTYFGCWVRAGDTGQWTHLVTMDVATQTTFQGGTDAFIEDWLSTGAQARTIQLRGGWKRRTDGSWFPFGGGRYSVNAWDLEPGKRSFHFRSHWNAGIERDPTGEFYFMTSGGHDTRPAIANPSQLSIRRTDREPQFARLKLGAPKWRITENSQLTVDWLVDETSTPPFAYDIQVLANERGEGEPLTAVAVIEPHARSAVLDARAVTPGQPWFLVMRAVDVLNRPAEKVAVPLTIP